MSGRWLSEPDLAWNQGGEILSTHLKISTVAEVTLDSVSRSSAGLAAMEPFIDIFRDQKGIRELRKESDVLVGQLCNFAPEELVLAAGAVPIRLDMFHSGMGAIENPVAVDVCCAVRQLMVSCENPMVPLDLLIIGATCDGRAKMAFGMSSQDEVMVLELPRTKRGKNSMLQWRGQVKVLIERLEQLTGRRIRRKALLESIELLNRRTSIMRAINDLRVLEYPPISGTQAMLLIQSSFVSHPRWWCEHAQVLLEQLQKKPGKGDASRPRARILLTGSSVLWPDYSLLLAISSTGAEVVADETCAGSNHLHHPAVVDEKNLGALMDAVAEKALLPHGCPFFGEYKDRLDRIAGLVKKYKIDGVVHHSLRGCQLFQMDYRNVKTLLDGLKVPCIDIHTELGQDNESSLQNRIEAFVEMLSLRSSRPDA